MTRKSVSMNRVYDVFAEQTRKQARLYNVDTKHKSSGSSNKKNTDTDTGRKAAKAG